jgi:hypothetical protein
MEICLFCYVFLPVLLPCTTARERITWGNTKGGRSLIDDIWEDGGHLVNRKPLMDTSLSDCKKYDQLERELQFLNVFVCKERAGYIYTTLESDADLIYTKSPQHGTPSPCSYFCLPLYQITYFPSRKNKNRPALICAPPYGRADR